MLAHGDIDAMVTGLSRNYLVAYDNIRLTIDQVPGAEVFGLSMMMSRGRTVFVADTAIKRPSGEQLARIARQCAEKARAMGHEPRVAFFYHMLITAIHLALWQRRCETLFRSSTKKPQNLNMTERYRQMLRSIWIFALSTLLPAHRASQHSYHARPSRRGDIIPNIAKTGRWHGHRTVADRANPSGSNNTHQRKRRRPGQLRVTGRSRFANHYASGGGIDKPEQ